MREELVFFFFTLTSFFLHPDTRARTAVYYLNHMLKTLKPHAEDLKVYASFTIITIVFTTVNNFATTIITNRLSGSR